MTSDLLAAIKQIASERDISVDEVLQNLRDAMASAIQQARGTGTVDDIEEGSLINVEIDPDSDSMTIYADKKVVANNEVSTPATQISLSDAHKLEPKLQVGDHVWVDITATMDFGRVMAQAVKQVLLQRNRESEKESIIKQFEDKIGQVENALVQRMDREGNLILEIQRATAKMPPEEQISSEFYPARSKLKVFLKKIHRDAKEKTLIVSRSDPNFLRALFEIEVPEVASGTVEIVEIAREAGSRSKVAVKSNTAGVDPIGSCVGQRGARIMAITNELKLGRTEEKIDIIPWDAELTKFIGNAISPAVALDVKIIDENSKQALILVDDEKLSLAIGREGQNVRLAAKLTGWNLDIQGVNMYEQNGRKSKFEMDREHKFEAKKQKAEKVEEPVEVVSEAEEKPKKKAAKKAKPAAAAAPKAKKSKAKKADAEAKPKKATKKVAKKK